VAELSIKVSIAGRVYPLSVLQEEEGRIREAAKVIDEMVKNFETKYAVKDKQDLLAMCALQFATQKMDFEEGSEKQLEDSERELKNLEQYLTDFLEKH